MKAKLFSVIALGVLMVPAFSGCSAIEAHHHALFANEKPRASSINQNDPISGEWNVMFYVEGHNTPATFTFKLDGQKVTGTAYSDHTGPGTIRDGKWADSRLSFTLDFK